MHRTMPIDAVRLAAGLALLLLCTGCADFAAVRTYADETKKLSAAFGTMPKTTVDVCEARFTLEEQTRDATAPFKVDDVRAGAAAQCAPLARQSDSVLKLVALLDTYADTLAALADDKLPNYTDDLDGVATAVADLKRESGEPVVPPDQARAVITLAQLVTRLATERAARGEIRQLLEQGEGVNATTHTLQWYAREITRPQLDTWLERSALLAKHRLPAFEKTEPIGVRVFAVALHGEQARVTRLVTANDDLIAAADKHAQATLTVREKFDKPDDKALREQLFDLAKGVNRARRHLQAAF